jgi:hypothetical protein
MTGCGSRLARAQHAGKAPSCNMRSLCSLVPNTIVFGRCLSLLTSRFGCRHDPALGPTGRDRDGAQGGSGNHDNQHQQQEQQQQQQQDSGDAVTMPGAGGGEEEAGGSGVGGSAHPSTGVSSINLVDTPNFAYLRLFAICCPVCFKPMICTHFSQLFARGEIPANPTVPQPPTFESRPHAIVFQGRNVAGPCAECRAAARLWRGLSRFGLEFWRDCPICPREVRC